MLHMYNIRLFNLKIHISFEYLSESNPHKKGTLIATGKSKRKFGHVVHWQSNRTITFNFSEQINIFHVIHIVFLDRSKLLYCDL